MKKTDTSSLSYEQALAELESIVSDLEIGQTTLEEAMHLYERGQALSKYCLKLLDQVELKVQELSNSSAQDEDAEI